MVVMLVQCSHEPYYSFYFAERILDGMQEAEQQSFRFAVVTTLIKHTVQMVLRVRLPLMWK